MVVYKAFKVFTDIKEICLTTKLFSEQKVEFFSSYFGDGWTDEYKIRLLTSAGKPEEDFQILKVSVVSAQAKSWAKF